MSFWNKIFGEPETNMKQPVREALDAKLLAPEPRKPSKNPRLEFEPSTDPRGDVYGGILRIDAQEVPVERLDHGDDEGTFTAAFRDKLRGDVYALTDSRVKDKDAVAAAHKRDPQNPHLPAVEKLGPVAAGPLGPRNVYRMPHYQVPPPWSTEAAEVGARLNVCAQNTDYFTNRQAGQVLACARNWDVNPHVVRALELLVEEGAQRGNFALEFPRKNLGADADGNLVLLDVLYPW